MHTLQGSVGDPPIKPTCCTDYVVWPLCEALSLGCRKTLLTDRRWLHTCLTSPWGFWAISSCDKFPSSGYGDWYIRPLSPFVHFFGLNAKFVKFITYSPCFSVILRGTDLHVCCLSLDCHPLELTCFSIRWRETHWLSSLYGNRELTGLY